MPTVYTSNLALALPATGELSGTWGSVVNSNITNMLDEALGYQIFTATGGSDTLTIPDGTTGVARSIYIQLNGTGGGTVNVPTAKTKMYFVFNNTVSAITFKVTGQTGVSIPAAAKIALVSNGTDIIVAENYLAALTLGAALPVTSGGTGVVTSTGTGSVVLSSSPALTTPTLTLPTITNYVETPFSANSSTAITLDLTNGTVQIITLTGNCVYTFPTPVAGKSFTLIHLQDATGSRTVTWPATVDWPSAIAPTLTATALRGDKFVFTAISGTSWLGSVAGQNYTV
jgi:hypothetical protein